MLRLILGLVLASIGAGFTVIGGLLVKDGWKIVNKSRVEVDASTLEVSTDSEGEQSDSLLGPEDADKLRRLRFTVSEFEGFNRWQRHSTPVGEHFVEDEVLLAVDGELIAYASIFNIHAECAWKSKEWNKFVYENNTGCDIGKLFSRSNYQRRLASADHLVFIGLESYLNAPTIANCAENHDTIAQCRSYELFKRTESAIRDTNPLRRYWGISLGYSMVVAPDSEFDQRRAITIGVRERVLDFEITEIISMLILSSSDDKYDLSKYSESYSAKPTELYQASITP